MKLNLTNFAFSLQYPGTMQRYSNDRFSRCQRAQTMSSAVTFNYRYMRCAQFGLWQGARRAHTPQWVCNRRATQPQAKFGATLRAAVLFRPDFVARSLQIHFGICSSLTPRLAKKSLAAHVSIIKCHSTTGASDFIR